MIVVDDGSDDATPDLLAAMDDPFLRVLRRDPPDARQGKAAALNNAWHHVHAHGAHLARSTVTAPPTRSWS